MNEITKNLYYFYGEAGTLPGVSIIRNPAFSMVCGDHKTWPQMIFNIDLSGNPAEKLAFSLKQSVNENLPGFAVCDAGMFKTEDLELLRNHQIYPVKSWTLMDAAPEQNADFQQPHDVEISHLTAVEQLLSFSA